VRIPSLYIFGGSSGGADTTIMKNASTCTYWLRENVTTFFTDKISIFVSFRIDVAVATICTGVHLVLGQEREYKGESIFRMFQDGESVPVSVNKVWHLPVGQHGHILRKQDHRPRPVQDPRSRDHNAGM
jgi:hypothetical protein